MPRIDTSKDYQRWRYGCPKCGSTGWNATNGSFYCTYCESGIDSLRDKRDGTVYDREEIEFTGPRSWKAPYPADPTEREEGE